MKNPPFCPNPDCNKYNYPEGHWYVKNGTFQSRRSGRTQRFRCKTCASGFSEETFSLNYRVQLIVPYKRILEHLVTSSGIRDLSRILKVSCTTVTNRIARLARQAMAVSARLGSTLELNEDLVADGFESFTKSQYLPNNINILTGKDSQFWFLSDYAHLSRKGRMTNYQKSRNEEVKKNASINQVTIYKSFQNVVRTALELKDCSEKETVSLYTDEHLQYKRVIDLISDDEKIRLRHIRINSRKARIVTNPLFSVNYIDREIRKDNSDHTRETVQFARNVANAMDRLAIYRMYHNFIKPFRINGNQSLNETHGSMAGISKRLIRSALRTLFTQRRFLGKQTMMNISDRKLWCRCIATPLSTHADYLPGYAIA